MYKRIRPPALSQEGKNKYYITTITTIILFIKYKTENLKAVRDFNIEPILFLYIALFCSLRQK